MWLWQHKNIYINKKQSTIFFSVSLFLHIIILGWMLRSKRLGDYRCVMHTTCIYTPVMLQEFLPNNVMYGSDTSHDLVKKNTVATHVCKEEKKQPIKKTAVKKQGTSKDKKKKQSVIKKEEPKKISEKNSATHSKNKSVQSKHIQKKLQSTELEKVKDKKIEVDSHEQYVLLQEEFERCWKPPIGILPTYTCELTVTIGYGGTVQMLETTRSSEILMYDVAARSAVTRMKFPRWTWGQVITLVFKP